MAERYGVGKEKILKYARDINYDNYHFQTGALNEEDKKIICELYGSKTSKELAEMFHAPRGTITKLWHDNGLIGKDRHIYPFTYNYFENINSKDKAYFLGWLASDGNVFKRKNEGQAQATIKISLDSKDYLILETLKKYIDSEKPLSYIDRTTPKGLYRQSVILELVSDKMMEDLKKYNIVPYKSYEYKMVNLGNEFMSHWFRGYFDGDGTIFYKSNKITQPSEYVVGITGFVHNLQLMKDYLEKNGIKSSITIDQRKTKLYKNMNLEFGTLRFLSIEEKYKFLKYIYTDIDDLYLHRKKYITDCFISAIKNNYSNKPNLYHKILENAVLDETNK